MAGVDTLEVYVEVLTLLFELAKKKPWLRESCAWTICSSVASWPAEVAARAARLTYEAVVESGLVKSSEGVAVWLVLAAHHPDVPPPKDVWVNNSPLDSPNMASLGKILKEAGDQEGSNASKGSWNPKLHFVWDFILNTYFSEEGVWSGLKDRVGIAGWAELWRVVIDGEFGHDLRYLHFFPVYSTAFCLLRTNCCGILKGSSSDCLNGPEVYSVNVEDQLHQLHPGPSIMREPGLMIGLHLSINLTTKHILYPNQYHLTKKNMLTQSFPSESLFSASSSDERKFHGFLLFTKSLPYLTTPTTLSPIFTKNFMRSLINQLSDPTRYLHKVATKCSRALLTKAETSPWSVPVIITQLTTNNGTPNFDHLTKTKNVDKILCLADEDGLVEVMGVLKGIILTPEVSEDIKTAEVRRQWACDQILSVVRNGRSLKSDSWLKEVVEMLATFGHFDIVDKERPAPDITANSQAMFRSRLLSCLSHLITIKEGEEGGETWPYKAVKTIEVLQRDSAYSLAIEVDEVIEVALKGAMKTLERIRKKRSTPHKNPTKSSQLSSFELLYSLVILQVYAGETDALGVLDELQICYDKVVRHSKKDGDIDASQVLVEILLSFLSKPSVLLRKLAQQVFTNFIDKITIGGLEATFGVLETKESLGGQQELFEGDEGDIDMEGDSDSEDSELDSDVEVIDAEEMDIDSDTNSEEDETEDETEASKLEAALEEAISAANAAANDSDDSDMDDDAMLALDEHLVKIFKQRNNTTKKSKKQESKNAKETITNFKNRVLDLLDIFAKSPRAHKDITISATLLLPLLRCARTTGSKQVADHAATVVRNLANSLRGKEAEVLFPGVEDKETLWELLSEIHEEAAKDGGAGRDKHKSACSQASLLVMKVIVASGGMKVEDVERAVGMYAKSLTRLLTERSWRVQSGLFTDFINWAASAGKRLQNEK